MRELIRMTWPEYLRAECLYRGGRIRFFVPGQIEVLSVLLLNRGRAISERALIESVWLNPWREPRDPGAQIRAIIRRLRQRMPGLIFTAERNGYGWTIPQPGKGPPLCKC